MGSDLYFLLLAQLPPAMHTNEPDTSDNLVADTILIHAD